MRGYKPELLIICEVNSTYYSMNYVGKILRYAGVCVVHAPLIERICVAGAPIAYGFSAKATEGKTHSLLEIAKFWLMYGNKIF